MISNKKTIRTLLTLVLVSLMMFMPIINTKINNNLHSDESDFFPDVIVLQVGTDYNTQLAVDVFFTYHPENTRLDMITSWSELQTGILSFPETNHVIFGHGTEGGLSINGHILPWEFLINFIESNKVPICVMACHSGLKSTLPSEYYVGFFGKLDAEAAGIFAAISFVDKLSFNIDHLYSKALLKQRLLKHPLVEVLSPNIHKFEFQNRHIALVAVISMREAANTFNLAEYLLTFRPNHPFLSVLGQGAIPHIFCSAFTPIQQVFKNYANGQYIIAADDYVIEWLYVQWIFNKLLESPVLLQRFVFCAKDAWNFDNLVRGPCVLTKEMLDEIDPTKRNWIDIIIDFIWFSFQFKQLVVDLFENPTEAFAITSAGAFTTLYKEFFTKEMYEFRVEAISVAIAIAATFAIGYGGFSTSGAGVSTIEGVKSVIPKLKLDVKVEPVIGLLGALLFGIEAKEVAAFSGVDTTDTDGDGIIDSIENKTGLNFNSSDTDGDGWSDYDEIFYGWSPLCSGSIFAYGTNATFSNTDIFADGDNRITIEKEVQGIDWINVTKREHSFPGLDEDHCGWYNVTDKDYWEQEFDVYDRTSGTLTLTEFECELFVQNDTAGAESKRIKVATHYAYSADNDAVKDDNWWDTDSDDLPDYFETFCVGLWDGDADCDNDGLDNGDEVLIYGTDANDNDTDNDGITDDVEIYYASGYPDSNEANWDVDDDGFPNWLDFDSDNDGLNDSYEDTNTNGYYNNSTDLSNLIDNDTDDDGIIDGIEVLYMGTEPNDTDTDDDGFNDRFEAENFLNPLVPDASDWALYFADDFAENEDMYDQWDDISEYGSMRTGGLDTTTYSNVEALDEYVVRVYNFTTDSSDDLVSYWPFEAGSGSTAYDYIGDYNLTLTNSPAWSTGQTKDGFDFGKYLHFDGSNDEVLVSTTDGGFDKDYDDEWSVSFWFKSDN